jgi:hypothetical protein
MCVWGFAALVLGIAFIRPLTKGIIAQQTWQRIPCNVTPQGDKFFYVVNEKNYYSERLDFWDEFHHPAHLISFENQSFEPNGWCYVQPGDPLNVVLNADTYRQTKGALTRIIPCTMLLVVAVMLTIMSNNKSNKKRGRSPQASMG